MDHKSEIVPIDANGVVLSVLAVPSWMTPSDFLAFVAPAAQGMSHIRMIRSTSFLLAAQCVNLIILVFRDTAPNRSIVLIKFRQAEDAAEFIEAYNGRPFNSMEVGSICCSDCNPTVVETHLSL